MLGCFKHTLNIWFSLRELLRDSQFEYILHISHLLTDPDPDPGGKKGRSNYKRAKVRIFQKYETFCGCVNRGLPSIWILFRIRNIMYADPRHCNFLYEVCC